MHFTHTLSDFVESTLTPMVISIVWVQPETRLRVLKNGYRRRPTLATPTLELAGRVEFHNCRQIAQHFFCTLLDLPKQPGGSSQSIHEPIYPHLILQSVLIAAPRTARAGACAAARIRFRPRLHIYDNMHITWWVGGAVHEMA